MENWKLITQYNKGNKYEFIVENKDGSKKVKVKWNKKTNNGHFDALGDTSFSLSDTRGIADFLQPTFTKILSK